MHTGIYFALTGRKSGSKATQAEVWAWLTQVFRTEHPDKFNALLRRQQERQNWEKSRGRYSQTDANTLNKAFVNLYANTTEQQGILGEDELDAIVDALGLKGIKSLLKHSISAYLTEQSVQEDALKDIFVFLADLNQDEFDATVQLFATPGLVSSTSQSLVYLLGEGYYKLGELCRGVITGTFDVTKELGGYLSGDVKRIRQRVPPKRSVAQKSKSARRALFGKYTE